MNPHPTNDVEVNREALAAFRETRDSGRLPALLESFGIDPEFMLTDADLMGQTDATVAEAYAMGVMAAALNAPIRTIVLGTTGPTVPTDPRRRPAGGRRRP